MIYQLTDDGWVANEYALAFWYPGAVHGGPLAALVVHLIEGQKTSETMQISRLYMSIMRPVLCDPLRAEVSVERSGRKIQMVQVRLYQHGKLAVQAMGLKYRNQEGIDPRGEPLPEIAKQTRQTLVDGWMPAPPIHFAKDAVELTAVSGQILGDQGQGSMWLRYCLDEFIAGQVPSNIMKLAMYSDFGNALSSLFSPKEGIFINADLSLEIFRYPSCDPVYLQAQTFCGSKGFGVVHGKLYDEQGLLGFCHQTVLLDKR